MTQHEQAILLALGSEPRTIGQLSYSMARSPEQLAGSVRSLYEAGFLQRINSGADFEYARYYYALTGEGHDVLTTGSDVITEQSRTIIQSLSEDGQTVAELSNELDESDEQIEQRLKSLNEVGFVRAERQSDNRLVFSPTREGLRAERQAMGLFEWLQTLVC